MPTSEEKKRDAFLKKLASIGSGDPATLNKKVAKMIATAGYVQYLGYVSHAGIQKNSAGIENYFVSFMDTGYNGASCSGGWPDWAFPIARECVLHGKKLWMIADGSPCGHNLIAVAIYHESV